MTLALVSIAAPVTRAQDVLWYSFESNTGTTVRNRAPLGPSSATIVSTNKNGAYFQGIHADNKQQQDYALASFDDWDTATRTAKNYNYLDTGWTAAHTGSCTIAFFVRSKIATQPGGAQYLFGGDDGFRCFTEGRAKSGLSLAGWGGFGYLDLPMDLRILTWGKWVHVAIVLDDSARLAKFYVDGKEKASQVLFGPIAFGPRKNGLRIGAYDTLQSPSVYNVDDFRFTARALTESEIEAWRYQSGAFGAGCKATLDAVSGAKPILGGANYELEIRGQSKALAVLGLGLSSTKLGAIDLPLDLGPLIDKELDGCKWYTSSELMIPLPLDAAGYAKVPLPMPTDPNLSGLPLWFQALASWTDSNNTTKWQTTNGWRLVFVPR